MAVDSLDEHARRRRRQRRREEARSYVRGVLLPVGASLALGYGAAGVF